MSVKIRNSKNHKLAVILITDYSNKCPNCQSIIDPEESSITCEKCNMEFSEKDYMDKFHIIALLRVNNLSDIALDIENMDLDEYNDFLVNNIY